MKPYAEKPKIPANTPTRVIGQVTPLSPQRVKENAVPPKRISSAKWWIIGGVVAVVLLLGCMISAIIFAAIDSSKPVPFNTNTNTDPQLRGWTTTEGDSFVTTVTTPDGPAIVVQNDESNFLIHRNGMRVPVIYNSQTNMWQNLPPE